MRVLLHLTRTELRTIRREWLGIVSLLLIAVLLGVSPYGLRLVLARQASVGLAVESTDPPVDVGCADVEVAVGVAGELPPWVALPQVVSIDEAPIIVAVVAGPPVQFDVIPIEDVGLYEMMTVRGCLWEGIREQKDERLDALGIVERPGWFVRSEFLFGDAGSLPSLPVSELGSGLLSTMLMVLMGVFTDILPRTRSSGYLESLLVTPLPVRTLVGSWWLVGMIGAAAAALVLAGAYLGAGALLGGMQVVDVSLPVVLMSAAALSALVLYAFIDVTDARAALLTAVPIGLTVVLLVGGAVALEGVAPGLGALVPVGGALASLLGLVEAPWLAALTGGLSAAVLLAASVRRIGALDLSAHDGDELGRRQASGDFMPEVLFLFVLTSAGSAVWMPAFLTSGHPEVALVIGQVMFVLAPSLFVSVPSTAGAVELLGMSERPALRAWALTPLIGLGATSMVLLLFAQGGWVFALGQQGHALWMEAAGAIGLPAALLWMAALPAVCEELAFRGAMLGMLRRRWPVGVAVLIQAVLFSLAHAASFKLIPMFALAVLLGLLAVRTRSIIPGMYVRVAVNLALVASAPHLEYATDVVGPDVLLALVGFAVAAPLLVWWSGPGPDDA